ncbi:putative F-box protein At1g77650 isoform X2 [Triticum aestivum]|uniref:putative F-box protein At1g77650 isoform X2 n=1 Tax=Triticum aestivum TaxID=4565 RepID=UPI001D015C50|nr:putative F-box protein At1g77650 isoform X2 [Triticum aestivum]
MKPTKKKRLTWLPQDIIELILVRLPVSNLLRCRVVCKQWDGIIRDPQFTMAHLRHAQRRPLLFFQQDGSSGKLCPSEAVLFDEAWSPSKWDVPVVEPDDFLCGSCNGLLCLYSSKSTIKIANLATGECMHLAKPVKMYSTGDHPSFYSFGFSPATNEYKVLHFLPGNEHHHVGGSFSVIQVYTLGDEQWRVVRTEQALSLYCVKQSGVVNVDGAMYWLTHDKESSWRRAVVSFDLRDECLKLIRLPEVDFADPAFGNPFLYWITEIDSKVSVAAVQVRRDTGLTGKLHIWTLDNKTEQSSWIQTYSIELSTLKVLGPHFIYGDKIIMHSVNGGIYCHELTSQRFTIDVTKLGKLLLFSPRCGYRSIQSCMYVKSLVRLDAYKKAGIVRTPKRKEGWKLKKWEAWEHDRSEIEELWRSAHRIQQRMHEMAHVIGAAISLNLPAPPDQDSPHRRLNWVEQRRMTDMLESHVDSLDAQWKVLVQAADAFSVESKKMIPAADQAKRNGEESEAGSSRPKGSPAPDLIRRRGQPDSAAPAATTILTEKYEKLYLISRMQVRCHRHFKNLAGSS